MEWDDMEEDGLGWVELDWTGMGWDGKLYLPATNFHIISASGLWFFFFFTGWVGLTGREGGMVPFSLGCLFFSFLSMYSPGVRGVPCVSGSGFM